LSAIHALFIREHNQIAAAIAAANHSLSDEQIFQMTRRIVAEKSRQLRKRISSGAIGIERVRSYSGYDADVNAGIANEFSTAAYRIGHTSSMMTSSFSTTMVTQCGMNSISTKLSSSGPAQRSWARSILKYLATDTRRKGSETRWRPSKFSFRSSARVD